MASNKDYQKGLSFRQAWFQMLNGAKIKLPSWYGYWAWEDNTIKMHCKDGTVLDIRETDNPAYTFSNVASDDWMVADDYILPSRDSIHINPETCPNATKEYSEYPWRNHMP